MLSRLIRTGDPHAKSAIPWKPSPQKATVPVPSFEPRPDAIAIRELEARANAAYQQGFAAGQAAGAQQAAGEIEPAIASLNRVVADLAASGKRFRAEAETDTVKLAIAVARRVLHRELATDPEAIHGLIIAAFQKLNAREVHRLRLSPQDAAIVDRNRSKLAFPPALEIIADGTLPVGSAVFETSRGELDASVDTQLAEIERGFADLVRRRAR